MCIYSRIRSCYLAHGDSNCSIRIEKMFSKMKRKRKGHGGHGGKTKKIIIINAMTTKTAADTATATATAAAAHANKRTRKLTWNINRYVHPIACSFTNFTPNSSNLVTVKAERPALFLRLYHHSLKMSNKVMSFSSQCRWLLFRSRFLSLFLECVCVCVFVKTCAYMRICLYQGCFFCFVISSSLSIFYLEISLVKIISSVSSLAKINRIWIQRCVFFASSLSASRSN